jgi:hypothetical protein
MHAGFTAAMHLTAALRRHGAPLAVVAGITLFAGALGGLTGIDRRLQADVSSPPGTVLPAAGDGPAPLRVSDHRGGGACSPGDGPQAGGRGRPFHDAREV